MNGLDLLISFAMFCTVMAIWHQHLKTIRSTDKDTTNG